MSQSSYRCALGAFWLLWLAAGCLTPLDDGGTPYSSYLMPAETTVPELEADPDAAKKLALNAGLGPIIKLRTGYFGGAEVKFWDLGELTATTLRPMYIFRRKGDDATTTSMSTSMGDLSTHPSLIDGIPGDSSYSPLRQIFVVYVKDSYRGEHITSIRALEDAIEIGIVTAPSASTFFANCVVVPSSARLQTADSGEAAEPEVAYYRGRVVRQFCIGELVSKVGAIMLNNDKFTPGNAYVLRRQNESKALDETLLDIDLNEDGDIFDTNTVFNDDVGSDTYSGIWKAYEVVVPRSVKLGDITQESAIFDRKGDMLTAKEGVISFTDRAVFLNRPIKWVR